MDSTNQHLLVQITNLSRMINNLSIRLNQLENSRMNISNHHHPLQPQVSTIEQQLLDSLNTSRLPNNNNNTTRSLPRQQYNPNAYNNLRRNPIRREPRQYDVQYNNPLLNTNQTHTFSYVSPTSNVVNTPITSNIIPQPTYAPPRRQRPNLHTPEVTRSYNSDGTLDSVEMTFTNMISPEEMDNIVRTATMNNPPNPTRRRGTLRTNDTNATNNNLINTTEDAQLFLNMLNTLSTTPMLNNESRRLTISDINNHTTVSTHTLPQVENNDSGDTSEEEICLICRAPFEEGDVVRRLNNCSHYFHCSCIDSWFELRNTCPICRHVITNDSSENIENNATNNQSNDILINIDDGSNNNVNTEHTVDRLD